MDHELLGHPIDSMIVRHSIAVGVHSIAVEEHSTVVEELRAIEVVMQVDSMLLAQCHAIKHYHKLGSPDTMLD